MKITILFLALIALGFSVKAQRMALADNKTHGTTTASASTPIPAKTPQFVFTNSAGRKSTNKQLRQNCRNAWMQPLSLTMRKKPESSKKP